MGEAMRDLIWVIGIFIAVGLLWLFTGGPTRSTEKDKPFLELSASTSSQMSYSNASNYYRPVDSVPASANQANSNDLGRSAWSGKVRLSLGNAQYEIQPMNEYVTLYSQSQTPINISGWRLVSSKQKVTYQSGSVAVPFGSKLFYPGATKNLTPIILEQGDQANIITGNLPSLSPYLIDVSFKTNVCSGYLEELPNYQFTPPLYSMCPDSKKAPGIQNLDDDCYGFIERLSYCHTPEFRSVRNYQGEMESGYVDDTPNLSTGCKNFLKDTYNYPACVDRNKNNPDFYGQTWYIYLNQKYELWGEKRETISLYDNQGLLVDQITY